MGLIVSFLKQTTKWVGYVVLTLACVMAAFGIALHFFNPNTHKDAIEKGFAQQTGQVLELNGPVSLKWFPHPSFSAQDAAIYINFQGTRFSLKVGAIDLKMGWKSFFDDEFKLENMLIKQLILTSTEGQESEKSIEIQDFSGELIYSACEISFPTYQMTINDTHVKGNASLATCVPQPVLIADLFFDRVIASKFEDMAASPGWRYFKGKIAFHVQEMVLPSFTLSSVEGQVESKDNVEKISISLSDETMKNMHAECLLRRQVSADGKLEQFIQDACNALLLSN